MGLCVKIRRDGEGTKQQQTDKSFLIQDKKHALGDRNTKLHCWKDASEIVQDDMFFCFYPKFGVHTMLSVRTEGTGSFTAQRVLTDPMGHLKLLQLSSPSHLPLLPSGHPPSSPTPLLLSFPHPKPQGRSNVYTVQEGETDMVTEGDIDLLSSSLFSVTTHLIPRSLQVNEELQQRISTRHVLRRCSPKKLKPAMCKK